MCTVILLYLTIILCYNNNDGYNLKILFVYIVTIIILLDSDVCKFVNESI